MSFNKYIAIAMMTILLSGCGKSLDYVDLDSSYQEGVITTTTTTSELETSLVSATVSETSNTTVPITETSATTTTICTTMATTTEIVTTTTNILSAYGDEEKLIDLATSLYQIACEMYWNYYCGSPYPLNYDDFIEDENGAVYFLIDSENIQSLEDVHKDWFQIFSSKSSPKNFDGRFIEKDGKVYVNDGSRGANIYYSSTEITGITSMIDNEVVFSAVSHYVNPEDNSSMEDQTYDFSIILEDGSYHVGEFTLPY